MAEKTKKFIPKDGFEKKLEKEGLEILLTGSKGTKLVVKLPTPF